MADALIQKIQEDFLSCCICNQELRDPVGLPCLHAFCFECLDTWYKASENKSEVICPDCKKPAALPKEGIRAFPGHSLVKNLKETVHMEKEKSTDSQDISCHICGKRAEVHCVDCNKSLCQQCLTSHNAFMKDHRIVTVEELQSGQVSDEGRFCKIHNEQVRYYCETEEKQVCMDCISLKACPIEHERVTLKEAAKKHVSTMEGLMKKCTDNKKKFQDAVEETKVVLNELSKSTKQSMTQIVKQKQQYMQRVEQAFDNQNSQIHTVQKARVKEIEGKQKVLESDIGKMEEACKQVSNLNTSKSEYLITHNYPSISKKLSELSFTQPTVVDRALGYLKFESVAMDVPPIGHLLQKERWKLCDQFPTKGLCALQGVAINSDGDVAVSSYEKGFRVYSKDGQVKYFFMNDQTKITDIAVSQDNRYIVANGHGYLGMQCYDNTGKHLCTIPILDFNNKKSNLNSVAIDTKGRIILAQVQNTISIHYADGSFISKFFTQDKPRRLAVTSAGQIVCSFSSKYRLEIMSYSGSNARIIQSPAEVKTWVPGFVCCGQGEIFVANTDLGDPPGIFRFTVDGDYLGCATTEVSHPTGIALSEDVMQLFVAERNDCLIKIFQRE